MSYVSSEMKPGFIHHKKAEGQLYHYKYF